MWGIKRYEGKSGMSHFVFLLTVISCMVYKLQVQLHLALEMPLTENLFQVSTKVLHLSKVNYEVDNTASKGWDATATITENIFRGKRALWLSYLGISHITYKEEAGNDKSKR